MKNHTRKVGSDQVQVRRTAKEVPYTKYAGVLTLAEVWQRLGVSEMLSKADIHYGILEDRAEAMSFVLTMAPFVGATLRRTPKPHSALGESRRRRSWKRMSC
jgi:hypothetical protein